MNKIYYRITQNEMGIMRAEFRYWWWPLWSMCFIYNRCESIQQAEDIIEKHKNRVVKYL